MAEGSNLHLGLKQAREFVGLSLEEAALLLGVAPEVLAAYEDGKRNPPLRLVAKAARLYGVSENALYNPNQHPKTSNLKIIICRSEDLEEDC